MGFLKPSQPTLAPTPTVDQTLTPVQQPISGSNTGTARTPSFLSSAALPPPSQSNTGGKTLLGQ
jgi:hypothetical protein